jgi:two-component system LytT family response regulator
MIKNESVSTPAYSGNVFIKNEKGFKRVNTRNIVFLEIQGSCCIIHLHDGVMKVFASMRSIMEVLDPRWFVRIHRSYSVNLEHIVELSKQKAITNNGKELKVGRVYYKKLMHNSLFIG